MSDIRFLIADDNAAVQTFLSQLLEGYGFDPSRVKTTASAQGAAELMPEFKPDFLLTDWFEEGTVSGLALAKLAHQHRADSRFAMMSKTATPDKQEESRAEGALFLLAKPFTAADLRLALRGALEKMALEHPKMAAHVNAQSAPLTATKALPKAPAPPQIRVPQYKPGDTVFYQGRPAKVKYVILRRGELVVQLEGHAGLVAAHEVRAG